MKTKLPISIVEDVFTDSPLRVTSTKTASAPVADLPAAQPPEIAEIVRPTPPPVTASAVPPVTVQAHPAPEAPTQLQETAPQPAVAQPSPYIVPPAMPPTPHELQATPTAVTQLAPDPPAQAQNNKGRSEPPSASLIKMTVYLDKYQFDQLEEEVFHRRRNGTRIRNNDLFREIIDEWCQRRNSGSM